MFVVTLVIVVQQWADGFYLIPQGSSSGTLTYILMYTLQRIYIYTQIHAHTHTLSLVLFPLWFLSFHLLSTPQGQRRICFTICFSCARLHPQSSSSPAPAISLSSFFHALNPVCPHLSYSSSVSHLHPFHCFSKLFFLLVSSSTDEESANPCPSMSLCPPLSHDVDFYGHDVDFYGPYLFLIISLSFIHTLETCLESNITRTQTHF